MLLRALGQTEQRCSHFCAEITLINASEWNRLSIAGILCLRSYAVNQTMCSYQPYMTRLTNQLLTQPQDRPDAWLRGAHGTLSARKHIASEHSLPAQSSDSILPLNASQPATNLNPTREKHRLDYSQYRYHPCILNTASDAQHGPRALPSARLPRPICSLGIRSCRILFQLHFLEQPCDAHDGLYPRLVCIS